MSGDNQLLFRAGSGSGGALVQEALFVARIPETVTGGYANELPIQQLSAFPEKMDLLENGRTIQIRNAFGAVRLASSGSLPMPIPGLPSFAGGNPDVGRSEEMAASADGRWLLFLDPVSHALGNLVMLDVNSGTRIQVASRLDRPEKIFPAAWSPDSRFFVYEREGKLYYYMAGSSVPAPERIRLIGEGTISSVSWGGGGDFYYLQGSTLYQVRGAELFARALYADFLDIGTVMGKIPFEFDPCFDNFWIAPDAKSLLVSKGRRSLFYYPLERDEFTPSSDTVLPYLLLPRFCTAVNVFWPPGGTVTILVSVSNNGGTKVDAWRLHLSEESRASFESLPPPGGTGSFTQGSLSPDGRVALFWGEGGVLLYDYLGWKLLEVLSSRPGAACLWAGNNELITGDDQKIEKIFLAGKDPGTLIQVIGRETLSLSRTVQAGFEDGSSRILAKTGAEWFVTDGKSAWVPVKEIRLRNPSQVSARYRVFTERQGPGPYANLPMIRNISSVGTFSLFPPAANSPGEPGRTGPKEAALCFDLYDDDQGLPEILDALNRSGVKATFFLNGEFIRRHPLAVTEIAGAGHEIASMFFALVDLADARYQGGIEFISRGLARNEDEFFHLTGRELALLWHPPWYAASPDLAAAAARAGYFTSGRDIDPLDWISREDEKKFGLDQMSPSRMVDRIMENIRPGFIVPIRLGLVPGGRNDYLFNRINVLLDALFREGYTITTVSALKQHLR